MVEGDVEEAEQGCDPGARAGSDEIEFYLDEIKLGTNFFTGCTSEFRVLCLED